MSLSGQSPDRDGPAVAGENAIEQQEMKTKHNSLKRFIAKIGLDLPTLILMIKGSLPPVIGLAVYQSPPIYSYFTTMGYLIPVVSVLTLAVLPRDRFIQMLALNLLAICLGSAVSLLAIWSSIQARIHTSHPLPQSASKGPPPYNSSQSAVCAIWLFANIWLANLVRAKLPSFGLPVVIYSILINTSTTLGPTITTSKAAERFVKEQLLAMIFGAGLSAGVSLLIFPISSRMVVMGQLRQLIGLLRKLIRLQQKYLVSVDRQRILKPPMPNGQDGNTSATKDLEKKTVFDDMAREMKDTTREIRILASKIHGNMTFAKRDTAWGKLDANDLSETFTLLRNVTIPIVALSSIKDIFNRVTERRKQKVDDETWEKPATETNENLQVWNSVMEQVQAQFQAVTEAIDQGLEHSGIDLEILPVKHARVSSQDDVEAHGDRTNSKNEDFMHLLEKRHLSFDLVNAGISTFRQSEHLLADNEIPRHQVRLYVTLYMQQLVRAAGEATRNLVVFADGKVRDGTMNHRRVIFPTERLLWKWLSGIFRPQSWNEKASSDLVETNTIHYGDGFNERKDMEHLPPTNIWQKLGDGLRKIPMFLGSKESAFGFRVACAAMTVGIVAFLEHSQHFFQEQRLDWAMVTIALGMTITSGQSVFGFFCRVLGTCLGMIFSFIIWFIVDQKTPGVIVFFWIFTFIEYYFLKFQRFTTAVMMTIITQIIIIGYELQVRRIGKPVATASGQPYYPIYLLGLYRLAVVAGGSLVAFFWTLFPYPLTDRTWLRQDLSATVYLVANYFSVLLASMECNLKVTTGDLASEITPGHRLLKVRQKLFGRTNRLLSSIESHLAWQRWEPGMGGRFPTQKYRNIIMHIKRIMSYLTLMSYSITSPPLALDPGNPDDTHTRWYRLLAAILPGTEPLNHTIITALILLSNSMLSSQRLPAYLVLPRSYDALRRLTHSPIDDVEAETNDADDAVLPERYSRRQGGNCPELVTVNLQQDMPDEIRQKRANHDTHLHRKKGEKALSATSMDSLAPDPHAEQQQQQQQQPGYAEFVSMHLCNILICDDLEGLAREVSGLVGVVDFSFTCRPEGGGDDTGGEQEKLARPTTMIARRVATSGKGKEVGV